MAPKSAEMRATVTGVSGPTTQIPDYLGGSLVNLIAELEHRLTGKSSSPRLHPTLRDHLPEGSTFVLVLFDGLGSHQLSHPRAATLRASLVASIDAPFPTTTTVSLSTIATGMAPAQHGILGYQLWMPELNEVANTIKWTTLWGEPLDLDTRTLLPFPNLWERLHEAGCEPITVQPAEFHDSPLSRLLYRGCRFEGVETTADLVLATRQLATVPGRLILTYLPHVDFAAHVHGQVGPEYSAALATADHVWSALAASMPQGAVLLGTADHGHLDFPESRRHKIPKELHDGRTFYGDSRIMFVRGDGADIPPAVPATWRPIEGVRAWWGPGDLSPAASMRVPDGFLVAADDAVILHKRSDERLTGHHGGLTNAERQIPLLVAR